jgi:quinol monooxygenase YgiN
VVGAPPLAGAPNVRECESKQVHQDLPAHPTEENALIYITVKKKLKPGTADAYLEASQAYTDATRAEPGNKFYEHYRSVDDPDTILTIEAFDDAAAGEAHVNSEHFQQGDGDAKQYIAERPDILYIDLADRDDWDKMSEF